MLGRRVQVRRNPGSVVGPRSFPRAIVIVAVVGCSMAPACGPASDQAVDTRSPGTSAGSTVGSTLPAGSTAAPTTTPRPSTAPSSVPTTPPPVAAALDPAELPPVIIGVYDWTKGSSFGSRLVSYDRRTHKQTDLLTSADLASLLPIDPPDATATTYAPELVTPPEISGADLSPDGQRVAVAVSWQHRTGSAEALVEVRVDGSAAPRVLLPATDSAASPIHGLARYSPDGAWLATGGGAISIWSMATGRIVAASAAMPYGPIGLAWSPDGSRLAWGDHFERTMQAQTSVAQLDNPAAPASLAVVDHVAGTTPWWSADGQLRTATAPAFARDVDAARTWVLGSRSDDLDGGAVERSYWWPATSDGADATPLHDLPDGFLALSW